MCDKGILTANPPVPESAEDPLEGRLSLFLSLILIRSACWAISSISAEIIVKQDYSCIFISETTTAVQGL